MKFSILILSLIYLGNTYCQQAADYFPQTNGYKWNYRLLILDSLNNPVPGMTFSRIDSSAFLDDYKGKNAYYIPTKTGPQETIQFQPFMDTNYVHLSGSDGYEYYKISELEFILSLIDSTTLSNLLPFIGLFESFSDWYLSYRFSQNVNQQYLIATFDTTIFFDSLEIPLRFNVNGKRLQDENLETDIGPFLCKKFLKTSTVNYLIVLPPPLPPIVVPIFTVLDTVWMAPDNWIVKEIIPSTNIDLTFINLGEYNIPGLKREIVSEITSAEGNPDENFTFNLNQNYPNPFNPSTKIKFNIKEYGYVSLKIYDVLGREVVNLFEGELNAGNHEVLFNIGEREFDMSTGVYFYTLEFSGIDTDLNYRETKKMLLIK